MITNGWMLALMTEINHRGLVSPFQMGPSLCLSPRGRRIDEDETRSLRLSTAHPSTAVPQATRPCCRVFYISAGAQGMKEQRPILCVT